jgi:hypothetical protein
LSYFGKWCGASTKQLSHLLRNVQHYGQVCHCLPCSQMQSICTSGS